MSGDASGRPNLDGAHPSRSGAATLVKFVQNVGDAWVEWTVVEVDASAVPGTRGARCLLFTREDCCVRRVWDYPANWRTLDDDDLAALSWRR